MNITFKNGHFTINRLTQYQVVLLRVMSYANFEYFEHVDDVCNVTLHKGVTYDEIVYIEGELSRFKVDGIYDLFEYVDVQTHG